MSIFFFWNCKILISQDYLKLVLVMVIKHLCNIYCILFMVEIWGVMWVFPCPERSVIGVVGLQVYCWYLIILLINQNMFLCHTKWCCYTSNACPQLHLACCLDQSDADLYPMLYNVGCSNPILLVTYFVSFYDYLKLCS